MCLFIAFRGTTVSSGPAASILMKPLTLKVVLTQSISLTDGNAILVQHFSFF